MLIRTHRLLRPVVPPPHQQRELVGVLLRAVLYGRLGAGDRLQGLKIPVQLEQAAAERRELVAVQQGGEQPARVALVVARRFDVHIQRVRRPDERRVDGPRARDQAARLEAATDRGRQCGARMRSHVGEGIGRSVV